MIVLLEPVCSSWSHEEGNAGFLQLVKKNSKKKILYIGEGKHVRCIRRICTDPGISYRTISKIVPQDDADFYKYFSYYFFLISKTIMKYKPERLFILCGYRPCVLAAELVSLIFSRVKINFLIHGMIEEYKGHRDSYAKLFWFSRYCKNLRFITYSPFCTNSYWGLEENKFVFLHHPYIKSGQRRLNSGNIDQKIVIGIIGACANEKAKKLISMVNQAKPDQKYEFWVASKFGKNFKYLKNVKILNLDFDRENKIEMMHRVDYLLLPYDKKEYALSASGVFWDAIYNNVPCLMLDCRYFKYYMPYKVGYQGESMKELCNLICERIQSGKNDKEIYFTGFNKIDDERNEVMKRLLQ